MPSPQGRSARPSTIIHNPLRHLPAVTVRDRVAAFTQRSNLIRLPQEVGHFIYTGVESRGRPPRPVRVNRISLSYEIARGLWEKADRELVPPPPQCEDKLCILSYLDALERLSHAMMSFLQEIRLLNHYGLEDRVESVGHFLAWANCFQEVLEKNFSHLQAIPHLLRIFDPEEHSTNIDYIRFRLIAYDLSIAKEVFQGLDFLSPDFVFLRPSHKSYEEDYIAQRACDITRVSLLQELLKEIESAFVEQHLALPGSGAGVVEGVVHVLPQRPPTPVITEGEESKSVAPPSPDRASQRSLGSGRKGGSPVAAQAVAARTPPLPLSQGIGRLRQRSSSATSVHTSTPVRRASTGSQGPSRSSSPKHRTPIGPQRSPQSPEIVISLKEVMADCERSLGRLLDPGAQIKKDIGRATSYSSVICKLSLDHPKKGILLEDLALLERYLRRIAQNLAHVCTTPEPQRVDVSLIKKLLPEIQKVLERSFKNLGKEEKEIADFKRHIDLERVIIQKLLPIYDEKVRPFRRSQTQALGGEGFSRDNPMIRVSATAPAAKATLPAVQHIALLAYLADDLPQVRTRRDLEGIFRAFGLPPHARDIRQSSRDLIEAAQIEGRITDAPETRIPIPDEASTVVPGILTRVFELMSSDPLGRQGDLHQKLRQLGFGTVPAMERLSMFQSPPPPLFITRRDRDAVKDFRAQGASVMCCASAKTALKVVGAAVGLLALGYGMSCAVGHWGPTGNWVQTNEVLASLCGCQGLIQAAVNGTGNNTMASATPWPSLVPSSVVSGSSSNSASQTARTSLIPSSLPTELLSASVTPTEPFSASMTSSGSDIPMVSLSPSSSRSGTGSNSESPSMTVVFSPSPTSTSARSGSGSSSDTPTTSSQATQLATQSASQTVVATFSKSNTASQSQSLSQTDSASTSASGTRTGTASRPKTQSASQSSSATATSTQFEVSVSSSRSATRSASNTATASTSETASASPTLTVTARSTGTNTGTASSPQTATQSSTRSFSASGSSSASFSQTQTRTASHTALPTGTSSSSQTQSFTLTPSSTYFLTLTSSATGTTSASLTPVGTWSSSSTFSLWPTFSAMFTSSFSAFATASATSSGSASATATFLISVSPTGTVSMSARPICPSPLLASQVVSLSGTDRTYTVNGFASMWREVDASQGQVTPLPSSCMFYYPASYHCSDSPNVALGFNGSSAASFWVNDYSSVGCLIYRRGIQTVVSNGSPLPYPSPTPASNGGRRLAPSAQATPWYHVRQGAGPSSRAYKQAYR